MPIIFQGKVENYDIFREFLERISILGKQKIEGVVIKNYKRFGPDGKALMGKFVSEEFKEVHSAGWKDSNPGSNGIIEKLIYEYKTTSRWHKAVQHLKEKGVLTDSPQDIGALLKEISLDTMNECQLEIREKLFDWAWGQIGRGITSGFPQWYKEELAKKQFEGGK